MAIFIETTIPIFFNCEPKSQVALFFVLIIARWQDDKYLIQMMVTKDEGGTNEHSDKGDDVAQE